MMKKWCMISVSLVLGLICVMPLQAVGTLDMARRITGHYPEDSKIKEIKVEDWDPESEEARQFAGPMDCKPSRIFESTEEPQGINSLEDLEDLVYQMHYELRSSQKIHFRSAEASRLMEEWIKKVNTLYSIRCRVTTQQNETYLQICYTTDARVFAAFRNPDMEKRLTDLERDVLDVCAQWICNNIQPGMPNLLKIWKVHDALVDNSRYTCGHYTTAEIVLQGKGVCAAYTSATQLLLHMVKIDCRSVLGTPEMNHIWNIIDVNGEWYQTDVTWDDPISPKGNDVKVYSYYLITSAEMDMDHDWDNPEIYPETPEINRLGIFKRHLLRGCTLNDDEELIRPREKESILQVMEEKFKNEAEERGDKLMDQMEPVTAPVSNTAGRASSGVASQAKMLNPFKGKKKPSKAEYKPVKSLDDLYENLKTCQNYLDGPTLEFDVECCRRTLASADFFHYIKHWNFRYDEREKKLYLDIEHWPHIRLLRSVNDEENKAKLTPEERRTLEICQSLVTQYGTSWKLDKQKLRDIYIALVRQITWSRGASDITKALYLPGESGSLGYSEAYHTVLSLMKIPCIMVHGRNHTDVHAWNLVRRSNGRWYHASAGYDDCLGNSHEHSFKYFLRCDDEIVKDMVWDKDETYATPVKNRKRAEEYGLLNRNKEPEHAPEPENKKTSIIPVM